MKQFRKQTKEKVFPSLSDDRKSILTVVNRCAILGIVLYTAANASQCRKVWRSWSKPTTNRQYRKSKCDPYAGKRRWWTCSTGTGTLPLDLESKASFNQRHKSILRVNDYLTDVSLVSSVSFLNRMRSNCNRSSMGICTKDCLSHQLSIVLY